MHFAVSIPVLFPGNLPDLYRLWVGAVVYKNESMKTTVIMADPGHKSL